MSREDEPTVIFGGGNFAGEDCPMCGGATIVWYQVQARSAEEAERAAIPAPLSSRLRICNGHCQPAQKHDGQLDDYNECVVTYGLVAHGPGPRFVQGVHIDSIDDGMWLTPQQALSLFAWLRQERPTLEDLAREDEGHND